VVVQLSRVQTAAHPRQVTAVMDLALTLHGALQHRRDKTFLALIGMQAAAVVVVKELEQHRLVATAAVALVAAQQIR
jgi:hypothetical protein